ncbi:MAG: 50S ribosomal protein L3 [Clostridiales bacterium]|nr:50S ribosomal protein L3 [Clostridiales bacterium]
MKHELEKAILAKKIGMTQIFNSKDELTPITVLIAGPCVVTQIKDIKSDGYKAVQVGFEDSKYKRLKKPIRMKFKKNNIEPKKILKEIRFKNIEKYNLGDTIKADIFENNDRVDVVGISKGKGYAGAIKRHNFSRGPVSHGSKYHRHAGSMGSATTPGKVKKGKKMPGQMGNRRVTVQNLRIFSVDIEKNLILLKGSVPGNRGTVVFLKNSVKT